VDALFGRPRVSLSATGSIHCDLRRRLLRSINCSVSSKLLDATKATPGMSHDGGTKLVEASPAALAITTMMIKAGNRKEMRNPQLILLGSATVSSPSAYFLSA